MKKTDRKTLDIIQHRIGACDTLIDYLHDDIAWRNQEPLLSLLKSLKLDLENQEDGINE